MNEYQKVINKWTMKGRNGAPDEWSFYDNRAALELGDALVNAVDDLNTLRAENARLTRELGEMKKAMRMEVVDSAKLESRIARLRALAKVVASESVHSLDRCGCLSAADKLKPLIAACDAHRDLDEGGE